MKKIILALGLVSTLNGCIYYTANQKEINDAQHLAITTQASFDFDCPKENLLLTDLDVLKRENFQGISVSRKYGVSGCGSKAVYIWVNGAGWVANTTGKSS